MSRYYTPAYVRPMDQFGRDAHTAVPPIKTKEQYIEEIDDIFYARFNPLLVDREKETGLIVGVFNPPQKEIPSVTNNRALMDDVIKKREILREQIYDTEDKQTMDSVVQEARNWVGSYGKPFPRPKSTASRAKQPPAQPSVNCYVYYDPSLFYKQDHAFFKALDRKKVYPLNRKKNPITNGELDDSHLVTFDPGKGKITAQDLSDGLLKKLKASILPNNINTLNLDDNCYEVTFFNQIPLSSYNKALTRGDVMAGGVIESSSSIQVQGIGDPRLTMFAIIQPKCTVTVRSGRRRRKPFDPVTFDDFVFHSDYSFDDLFKELERVGETKYTEMLDGMLGIMPNEL